MKKKLLVTFAGAIALAIVLSALVESRSITPPPNYRSGGPGDVSGTTTNRDCASTCHTTYGAAVMKAGWITSDIPASGYVPGQTYNITVSLSSPGTRYGFAASCQDAAGNFRGTLVQNDSTWVVTDADKSWIYQRDSTNAVANGLTHSIGHTGTVANPNFKAWTFGWTAPAAGTGTLTFYSSMVAGDNNWSATNDSVFNSTLQVTEDLVSGVASAFAETFRVFPNPSNGNFTINGLTLPARIEVVNLAGQTVYSAISKEPTMFVNLPDVASGIHFLKISEPENQRVEKLLIK